MRSNTLTKLHPSADELEDDVVADGRRQRSERSRNQIVQAMFDLVRAGDMHPSAARVADAAGVSLRTVFRHFEEMDSLYREMTAELEAEIRPLLEQPFAADTWRGRLFELIAQRAEIYERVMPLKVAASLRRFQSDYLRADYDRFLEMERSGLREVLPDSIEADATLFAALEMATGFQTWRRMRQDQHLTAGCAHDAVRLVVERLIAGL